MTAILKPSDMYLLESTANEIEDFCNESFGLLTVGCIIKSVVEKYGDYAGYYASFFIAMETTKAELFNSVSNN